MSYNDKPSEPTPYRGKDSRRLNQIYAQLVPILCKQLNLTKDDLDRIGPPAKLVKKPFAKLGADSLDHVELILEIEEAYNMSIPDGEAQRISTAGKAVKYISQRLKEIERIKAA